MQDVLPEGGVIRKLWIGETAKYRDHMLRLDPASRRSRFGGGVSDDFIRGYVNLSVSLDAVVHGFFVGGVMRGGAELRPLGARFPRQAEAAISVEKPWQSHGVGSALIRCTLLAARNRNFRLLHMACLAENRRMQQLARKFDAELSFDFGGVIGEVESSRATPLSLCANSWPTATASRPRCSTCSRAAARVTVRRFQRTIPQRPYAHRACIEASG